MESVDLLLIYVIAPASTVVGARVSRLTFPQTYPLWKDKADNGEVLLGSSASSSPPSSCSCRGALARRRRLGTGPRPAPDGLR